MLKSGIQHSMEESPIYRGEHPPRCYFVTEGRANFFICHQPINVAHSSKLKASKTWSKNSLMFWHKHGNSEENFLHHCRPSNNFMNAPTFVDFSMSQKWLYTLLDVHIVLLIESLHWFMHVITIFSPASCYIFCCL